MNVLAVYHISFGIFKFSFMFVVYKCLKWAYKPVTNKNVEILGMMNDGGKSSTLDKWGKISTRIINYL